MWLYAATEGTLTIDEVTDDAVSGSFDFTAVHEEDESKVNVVVGWFDQHPLVTK